MRFAIIPALLLFAAPACAQPATPPAPLAAEALNAHPALWVVKDPDTTVYLFGTVHILKPDIRWYGGAVKAAFESADELRLELVEPSPEEMTQLIATMAISPPSAPALSARLTPAQKSKYIVQMEANGLPWMQLERLEPWFVTITLGTAPLEKLGYSPESGVESTLTATAKILGKRVAALETAAEQLGFFDGLPEKAQIDFLNATVDELPKMEGEFAKLIASWSAGRDQELADELNQSLKTNPDLANVLLVQRNGRWADWIAQRMKEPGVVFVAVGAGHLAGDKSVQAELARLGFKTERVPTGK